MTPENQTHQWFAEQIAAYLTDGLEAAERERFESHVDACSACAEKLAEAKSEDESIRRLFETIAPSPDFEDRVIQRLRMPQPRAFRLARPIRLHPRIVGAAGAAAAIILLGGLGYGALSWMQNRGNQIQVASNLRQLGESALSSSDEAMSASTPAPTTQPGAGYRMVTGLSPTFAAAADINPGQLHGKDGQNVLYGDGHVEFQKNPFVGTNEDNIYTRGGPTWSTSANVNKNLVASPYVANDSVLLPTDDNDGGTPSPPQTPAYFKPADANGDLSGKLPAPGADQNNKPSANVPKTIDFETLYNEKTPAPIPSPNAGEPAHTPHTQNPTTTPQQTDLKIIRHGEMTFEVDSFDSSFLQITKIAAEEGGFVADTDSEKLPNGKMSGTVTVRIPPGHLDTLILKLRALGDLKSQKITADDITKDYTDLEGELRAAKAMEDRLMEIIKTGSGQVKDLLAAEKELGVWREKAEKITGEINYYNNLISLSTLQITLTERDIRQAATASEHETVDMGIETDDVEKARAQAMSALDDAKARIIQSDLKKLDAGQLAATIVAEISPDAAGPVIDRCRQLGRVARMNAERQQSVAEGATVLPGVKVERQPTRLQLSIYNLANVSPRQTTNITMACPDVEQAYHAILTRVVAAGGRVVDSSLNRVKPEQTDGTITFETPADKADAVLADVRLLGEVMHLNVTENPDAANVTTAKQGFSLTLSSAATVPARQTITTTIMPAGKVADAYHALLAIVQNDKGNIATSQLQEQSAQGDSATLVFDVATANNAEIEKAIKDAVGATGRIISRQIARSNDTEHTLDSKIEFNLTFASADALQPRETVVRTVAVPDVGTSYGRILASAQQVEAKIIGAGLDQTNPSNPVGQLDFIIARSHVDQIEKAIADSGGGTVSKNISQSADLNATTDEKVEIRLFIGDINQLPPRETATMSVQVGDPETASSDLQAAALARGGRVVEQHLVKDDKYQAHLVVQVPLSKAPDFIDQVRNEGVMHSVERAEDLNIPDADFAAGRIDITLNAAGNFVGPDAGLWAGLKGSLSTSIRGMAYSLELVVIGVCLALPWAVIAWAGWRAIRRFRKKPSAA